MTLHDFPLHRLASALPKAHWDFCPGASLPSAAQTAASQWPPNDAKQAGATSRSAYQSSVEVCGSDRVFVTVGFSGRGLVAIDKGHHGT